MATVLTLGLLMAGCAQSPVESSKPVDTGDPTPTSTAAGDESIATATATLEDGTVDVIVRSLELDDNETTMTLRVAFVPHLDDEEKSYTLSSMNSYIFVHPVLLDRENLKRYSVIEGEGSQDWLTNDDARTISGEPLESWFVYAAPEDPIDAMTFTIDAWMVELADIPIGGRE